MFRRGPSSLIGVLLILLALSAMADMGAGVIFLLLGLLALSRILDRNGVQVNFGGTVANEDEDEESNGWEERRPARAANVEPVYRHAVDAVKRAGHDPDRVQVLATDLGVLGFRGDEAPAVYRTWSLPDDLDYIQPFGQLRVPIKANGRVRFEILDADGTPVFIQDEVLSLVRGRNFITPSARLPIHDQRAMDGTWRMRVSADNVLLAVHEFQFAEAENAVIHQHIGEDGEITSELKAAMAESQLPRISLDDLLAHQEAEEAQQRARQ